MIRISADNSNFYRRVGLGALYKKKTESHQSEQPLLTEVRIRYLLNLKQMRHPLELDFQFLLLLRKLSLGMQCRLQVTERCFMLERPFPDIRVGKRNYDGVLVSSVSSCGLMWGNILKETKTI